ncbi:hypothetical protein IMY05_001G0041600 [Salix suchowensis]|nr:hypothetical protein IMY05_001G0041600 [Salix suchowensis]
MSTAACWQMDIIVQLSHKLEPSSCNQAEAMISLLWRLNELAMETLANKLIVGGF